MPIHSGHTLHQSGGPPARQRFSPSELRSILLGVSYSEPADPTEEDVKVLALFDNLMDDVAFSNSSDESLFASSMDDDDGDLLNPFMRNRRYILSASSDSDSLHSIGYSEDWDSFSDDWDTDSSSGEEEANESRLVFGFNNESGPRGGMVDREEEEEGTGEDEDSTEEETSLEEESSMEEEDDDEDAMNRVDMFVSHFIRAVTTAMRDSGGSPALFGGHGAGRVGECEDSSGDVISDSSCDDHLPTEPVDAGCISNDAGGSANSVPDKKNESLLSDTLALNDDVVKGNTDNLSSSRADSNVKKGAKAQSKRRERAKASSIVSDGKEGASVVTTKVEAKNSKSKRTGFTSVIQAAGGGGGGERGKQSKSGESLAVDQDQDSGMRLRTREISRSTRSKCGQRKALSRNESASCSGISDGACALDRPPGPSPCDSCEVELPGADGREKEVGAVITPLDGEDEGDVNNKHYCTRSKRKKIIDARARSGGLQDRYSADDFLRASSPNGSSETTRGKESERSGRKKGGRKKGKDSDAGNSNR